MHGASDTEVEADAQRAGDLHRALRIQLGLVVLDDKDARPRPPTLLAPTRSAAPLCADRS